MKINILGTEYDFETTSAKEDVRLCGNDGYTDFYEKAIRVENDYNTNDPSIVKDLGEYQAKVARHELVHAFFFESGLRDWAEDENLVDWLAIQFPKMLAAFQEVGAV